MPKKPVASASDTPNTGTTSTSAPKRTRAVRSRRRGLVKRAVSKATRKPAVGRRVGGVRRGKRSRYTDQQRQNILAVANREGLTALAVQKRFGVTPVTYYSWRKKSGGTDLRRKRAIAAGAVVGRSVAGAMNIADAIRMELRAHIRRLLPGLIQSEVGSALSQGRRRRRGR